MFIFIHLHEQLSTRNKRTNVSGRERPWEFKGDNSPRLSAVGEPRGAVEAYTVAEIMRLMMKEGREKSMIEEFSRKGSTETTVGGHEMSEGCGCACAPRV